MALKFTKKQIKLLPPYIKIERGSSPSGLRLQMIGNQVQYYRDAGDWAIDIRIDQETDKVYSISLMSWLHDKELIPITWHEWFDDNTGYVTSQMHASNDTPGPHFNENKFYNIT